MSKTTSLLTGAFLLASAGGAFAVTPLIESSGLELRSTLSESGSRNAIEADDAMDVAPGQTFTITGDCVMRVNTPESLQVVLSLIGGDAPPPGYRSVVATDHAFGGNGLQVRVPDMPSAANRIFKVRVFHLGVHAPQVCDAGAIRIGASAGDKLG